MNKHIYIVIMLTIVLVSNIFANISALEYKPKNGYKEVKDFKTLSAFESVTKFELYYREYLQSCLDQTGGGNRGIPCLIESDIWERELDVLYNKLYRQLNKKNKMELSENQRLWLEKKDLALQYLFRIQRKNMQNGSMFRLIDTADADKLMTYMIQERIIYLKKVQSNEIKCKVEKKKDGAISQLACFQLSESENIDLFCTLDGVTCKIVSEIENKHFLEAGTNIFGKHLLSLQWILGRDDKHFGEVIIKKEKGIIKLNGFVSGVYYDGRQRIENDYMKINGRISFVGTDYFKFKGQIITKVYHIANGKECIRNGEYTFAITRNRKYWRMQEMVNPYDSVADYIDIYFK